MIKKDNRGLSLVEVMIVIAIMGVVAAVVGLGINAMSGRPAQQCAQKIIYSLERHRTTAMSKVDASYTLRVDSSGKIVCDETVSNGGSVSTTSSELGTKRVRLFYETEDGSVVQMSPGMSVRFVIDRSSGAFRTIESSSGATNIVRVIAKSGGREVKVRFVRLTGKVYLD